VNPFFSNEKPDRRSHKRLLWEISQSLARAKPSAQRTEDRGQRTEDIGQRTEDRSDPARLPSPYPLCSAPLSASSSSSFLWPSDRRASRIMASESLPALLRSALCLVFLELSLAVRSARLSHHGELASASTGRCQKSQSSSLLGAVPSGGGAAVIGTTSGKLASASSDSCQSSSDAGAARSVSAPMG